MSEPLEHGRLPSAPGSSPDGSSPAVSPLRATIPSADDWVSMPWDDPRRIFVFGSNLAGRHGKGAALHARRHRGAVYGQAEGLQGTSYAIPTKDGSLRTLGLDAIREHVERFIAFARMHPELRFQLTAIGCGLAGYRPWYIAPMFEHAPATVELPPEFKEAMLGRIITSILDNGAALKGDAPC
jgi:hypothetical protein